MNKTNSLKQLNKYQTLFLTVFWMLILAFPIFLKSETNDFNWNHILNVWQNIIPYLLLFLLNRFVLLPYLYFKQKQKIYLIVVSTIILVVSAFYYCEPRPEINNIFDKRPSENIPFNPETMQRPLPPNEIPHYISFFILAILVVGFDTGLKTNIKWLKIEQNKIKSDKKMVESQLAFLKNQISPHFFMNTLNNIHSLIDIDQEEAKDSIIQLSKLMRHLLYDSEVNQIPIQKEFDFVKNYVNLMKLRYSDKIKIELELPEETFQKSISPLLFTSFVENAFKHGISYQHPSFIKIKFEIKKDRLIFLICNSNHKGKSETKYSGIGLINSRKRLDLLYGKNYSLDIQEITGQYQLKLEVPV